MDRGSRATRRNARAGHPGQCDSPLAVREALLRPIEEGATKVLITPLLYETDLGSAILLRLAKRRLFQIDSWQIRSLPLSSAVPSILH